MKNLGMPINTGNAPPNIENSYLLAPNILVGSDISSDVVGKSFPDARVKFYNQDNTNQTLEVKYDDGDYIVDGLGSFIAGSNNSFTVFAESIATDIDLNVSAKTVLVYSGTLTNGGVNDLHIAVFMVDNYGNPKENWLPNGSGRVIKDSDGFSGTTAAFKFSNIKSSKNHKKLFRK